MKTAVVRWLPWILVAVALGVFLLIPGANGPVLVLVWGTIVVAVRYGVGLLPERTSRLWADAVFIFGCFLAAFEGGWYLLPAALAFVVKDRAGGGEDAPFRGLRPRQEWLAGLAAGAVGVAGLAIAVWGPFYSSRSASIALGNVVEGPITSTYLAALGPTPRATIVLVIAVLLLAVIVIAPAIHSRTGSRWAHRLLAVAILGLGLIAIAGAFTLGPLLLPAIAIALLAWASGRETRKVHTS